MRNKKIFTIFSWIFLFSFILLSCTDEMDLLNKEGTIQEKDQLVKTTQTNALDLSPIELLGKNLFFDKISTPNNMSCADCHNPRYGFTGPIAGINIHGSVYRGAVAQRFGNRKPPSAAYATFSPIFYYDASEGIFIGGNFWDGRATGELLGNPAADQALGPFLNPVEHNVADKRTVLEKISRSNYLEIWSVVWGEPLSFETQEKIDENFDRVGLSIAAYEASAEVNQFTSKFDYYLMGLVQLTDKEAYGLELFEGKGKCALCHISEGDKPLFTDFTYDNVGAPKNPENPVYKYNPDFIDRGLGGFLETRNDYMGMAEDNMGKHKVPTLRNVDKKPGYGSKKSFLHNGVFKSLKEVVHFYNTRDVSDWPEPEVPENINTEELGDLGLTEEEENAIVAFLKTLSDGYVVK